MPVLPTTTKYFISAFLSLKGRLKYFPSSLCFSRSIININIYVSSTLPHNGFRNINLAEENWDEMRSCKCTSEFNMCIPLPPYLNLYMLTKKKFFFTVKHGQIEVEGNEKNRPSYPGIPPCQVGTKWIKEYLPFLLSIRESACFCECEYVNAACQITHLIKTNRTFSTDFRAKHRSRSRDWGKIWNIERISSSIH